MEDAPKNYRMERIERLLRELRYEIELGLLAREVPEDISFRFIFPISQKIPRGVVAAAFDMRPTLYPPWAPTEGTRLRLVSATPPKDTP